VSNRPGERLPCRALAFPALAAPALSRALLTPGPLPPLSHLGVTLLRHAVGTGLRYALYQLGLPLPEAPPVRIVRPAPSIWTTASSPPPGGRPGAEVVAALSDPGGAGTLPGRPRPRHRRASTAPRLHLFSASRPAGRSTPRAPRRSAGPVPRRAEPGAAADQRCPLADLLSALAGAPGGRRARRSPGAQPVRPTGFSPAARSISTVSAPGPSSLLGRHPERAEAARREAPAASPMLPHDPLRGRFREAYRVLLDRRPPLSRRGGDRHRSRSPRHAEDAFLPPLDLAGDLTQECKPSWLESGVRANRAEYEKRPEDDGAARTDHGAGGRGDGPARGAEGLGAGPCCRCHSVRIASGWVHALWPSVSRYGSAPETLGQGRRKPAIDAVQRPVVLYNVTLPRCNDPLSRVHRYPHWSILEPPDPQMAPSWSHFRPQAVPLTGQHRWHSPCTAGGDCCLLHPLRNAGQKGDFDEEAACQEDES